MWVISLDDDDDKVMQGDHDPVLHNIFKLNYK